jgi:YrbI family 3-deoxy-D-manno-octulosonate 8-phosphate phosphatase
VNYDPLHRPRRQDFEGYLMENGAFYFTKNEILTKYKNRLGGKIGIYEMPEDTALEIDELSDWRQMEQLLIERRRKNQFSNISNIKLFVVDVDGTLTDAGMYYSSEGEQLKKFNTHDARGLELLGDKGIRIIILTGENSEIVTARARKLGIQDCFIGIKDKHEFLEEFCLVHRYSFADIAYAGDDLNDLECMKRAGFAACPADAVDEIKNVTHYVSPLNAGQGAVRDICDYILKSLA